MKLQCIHAFAAKLKIFWFFQFSNGRTINLQDDWLNWLRIDELETEIFRIGESVRAPEEVPWRWKVPRMLKELNHNVSVCILFPPLHACNLCMHFRLDWTLPSTSSFLSDSRACPVVGLCGGFWLVGPSPYLELYIPNSLSHVSELLSVELLSELLSASWTRHMF